jgi:hypothetical protein
MNIMNHGNIIFWIPVIAIFALVFYLSRRKKAALRELAPYLNGENSGSLLGYSLDGEFQGLRCLIFLFGGNKSSPPRLEISLFRQFSIKLSISSENFLSKFGAKLGVVHEIQTGDESFDRDFYISSSTAAEALDCLRKDAIKDTIKRLFEDKFTSLTIDEGKIHIEKPKYSTARDLEPQRILYYLGELYALANDI